MSRWLQASRAAAGFSNKNGARPQPDPNGYTHMQTIRNASSVQHELPISTVEMVTPAHARHLRDTAHFDRQRNISAAVMAIALETFRYQPSAAFDFWRAAAHDNGLMTGQPEKALLSWLRNSRASGGQSAQREHCRAAALAWNAAFKDRQIQYVKPNQMGAFFLLGTPWANGLGD